MANQKIINKRGGRKRKAQYYYSLQFEFEFKKDNDTVYFAYALPYTLSDMTNSILAKEEELKESNEN